MDKIIKDLLDGVEEWHSVEDCDVEGVSDCHLCPAIKAAQNWGDGQSEKFEKMKRSAMDYAVVVEQYQKLLGVFTNPSGFAKIVEMKSKTELNYESIMKLAREYSKERPISYYSVVHYDFLIWIEQRLTRRECT